MKYDVIILTGPTGTSKSTTAFRICVGIANRVDDITLVIAPRNKIGGELPGDESAKMARYTIHLVSISEKELGENIIPYMKIFHGSDLRGHTLSSKVIFCDDAQDLTAKEMKTLYESVSSGSLLILAGDPGQCGRQAAKRDQALAKVIEATESGRLPRWKVTRLSSKYRNPSRVDLSAILS